MCEFTQHYRHPLIYMQIAAFIQNFKALNRQPDKRVCELCRNGTGPDGCLPELDYLTLLQVLSMPIKIYFQSAEDLIVKRDAGKESKTSTFPVNRFPRKIWYQTVDKRHKARSTPKAVDKPVDGGHRK
ncbi:hypothetical protein E1301_Tti009006 [Triplophysa tibetana]|uniref:Uncharacterized protein n=1 Tax=Triplophysa tibetana TaxID=1572043 RepID=A0A5A9P6J2_9TELE|nr:hypothetical protein E1301_Tti009006 [Triplophysa tibetana]